MLTFTCGLCGDQFKSNNPDRKYCSQRCSMRAYLAAQPKTAPEILQLRELIKKYPAEAEQYLAKIKTAKRRTAERERKRDRSGVNGRQWEAARAKVRARRDPCWICGKPIDWSAPGRTRWSFSVDHKIPRSKGGSHYDPANLETAHYGCNSSRGDGTKQMRKARAKPAPERW